MCTRSRSVLAAFGLAAAPALASTDLDISVLYTEPNAVTTSVFPNLIIEPSGEVSPVSFRGPTNPRIANDGTWYTQVAQARPVDTMEFDAISRTDFILQNGAAFYREGLTLPLEPDFVPVADFPDSQSTWEFFVVTSDGSTAATVPLDDTFTTEFTTGFFFEPPVTLPFEIPDGSEFFLSGSTDDDGTPSRREAITFNGEIVLLGEEDVTDLFPSVVLEDAPNQSAFIEAVGAPHANSAGTLVTSITAVNRLDTRFPSYDERALVRVSDLNGTPTREVLLTTAEDLDGNAILAPGIGLPISTFTASPSSLGMNESGDFVMSIDISGEGFQTDGALVRFNSSTDEFELLARESGPSPLFGVNWSVSAFSSDPVAINEAGDYAFVASLDTNSPGVDFGSNGVIGLNNSIIFREGDRIPTQFGIPREPQVDSTIAHIELDNEGNLFHYFAYNFPSADICPDNDDVSSLAIFETLAMNGVPFLETGRSRVQNVTLGDTFFPELVISDIPNQAGGWSVSPDGTRLVAVVGVSEPSDDICDLSVSGTAPTNFILIELDLDQVRACMAGDFNGDGDANFFDVIAGVEAESSTDDLVALLAAIEDCVGAES